MIASSNAAEMRSDLHQLVDRLDDRFVAIVYSMVGVYIEQQEDDPIIGYSAKGSPMYASVAKREFKARLEAIDRGDYITLEALKEQSKTWLEDRNIP